MNAPLQRTDQQTISDGALRKGNIHSSAVGFLEYINRGNKTQLGGFGSRLCIRITLSALLKSGLRARFTHRGRISSISSAQWQMHCRKE